MTRIDVAYAKALDVRAGRTNLGDLYDHLNADDVIALVEALRAGEALAKAANDAARALHGCAVDRTDHAEVPAEECEADECRDTNIALARWTVAIKKVEALG